MPAVTTTSFVGRHSTKYWHQGAVCTNGALVSSVHHGRRASPNEKGNRSRSFGFPSGLASVASRFENYFCRWTIRPVEPQR